MIDSTAIFTLLFAALPVLGQLPTWHDPSPHKVQFVSVEKDVKLEVLDWGGSGRPIVLLAGSGNTAHVFDFFALKLSSEFHVYGLTRRGFGESSKPDSGYDDQRLADDVLAVLGSLRIDKPVLVGHSMAGSEMTTLASQHSDRLSGLVYLDANDDPTDTCWYNPDYQALFKLLPNVVSHPAPPTDEDKKSFEAFYAYSRRRTVNFAFPESELRNQYLEMPDGSVGSGRAKAFVRKAIGEGSKKRDYSQIKVPILAFIPIPPDQSTGWSEPYRFKPTTDGERSALDKIYATDRTCTKQLEHTLTAQAPTARIVELRDADHYVFFSNEAEVLREMRAFIERLPPVAGR
jgi:non-heme chloroperoxidase